MTKTTDTPLLTAALANEIWIALNEGMARGGPSAAAKRALIMVAEGRAVVRPATDEGVLREAREALEREAVVTDTMSWHGELLVCIICGGNGTQAGKKRGVGDEPVSHKPHCTIARLAQPHRHENGPSADKCEAHSEPMNDTSQDDKPK